MSKNNNTIIEKGKESKSSFWSRDFISIILIPILSGVVGIIINFFGELCPWYHLVAGLGIMFIFVIVFYLIGLLFLIPKINSFIEKKMQEICNKAIEENMDSVKSSTVDIVTSGIAKYENASSLLEELSGKYLTLQQMIEMEQRGVFFGNHITRIDAITSTLKYDVPESDELSAADSYYSAVVKNLQNGVHYNYYYPSTPKNGDYKRQMMLAYRPYIKKNLLNFYEILPSDSDFLVDDFDFTLYTVDDNGKPKTYCILGIGTYLGEDQEPIMILAGQKMTDRVLSIYSKYNPEI